MAASMLRIQPRTSLNRIGIDAHLSYDFPLYYFFYTHKNPPRPVDLVSMNARRFVIYTLEMLEGKVF